MTVNVLVLGAGYSRAFPSTFNGICSVPKGTRILPTLKGFNLVCFTGGTDVNPDLYEEPVHPSTSKPDYHRDRVESEIYHECVRLGIPMVGICRGAQFLCVMNGGKLIQHVNNHAIGGTHRMTHYPVDGSPDCQSIQVTSTHHQMMWPFNLSHKDGDYDMVGWAGGVSTEVEGLPEGVLPIHILGTPEPEVVHFPKTKCLCVQGHPEYVDEDHEFRQYFYQALAYYLGVK